MDARPADPIERQAQGRDLLARRQRARGGDDDARARRKRARRHAAARADVRGRDPGAVRAERVFDQIEPGNPFLHAYTGDLLADVEALRAEGYLWIFIDTVPAMLEHIEHAIEAADFALLPTRVSMFDLAATRDVVALCQEQKKPFAFVLNATDPKWVKGIKSAVAVLKKLGPVIPKSIRQRTAYASALTTGKTGSERDKAAAYEIEALWATGKKLATAKARGK